MPLTGSSSWNSATADPAKHAIYVVRFAGLNSIQFSTGPVTSASRTTYQYLSDLEGLSQETDPSSGKTTIGALGFTLTDKSEEITALLDAELYQNQEITLLVGYAGLAESEFETLYGVSYLVGISTVDAGSAFRFETGDPRRPVTEDLFQNADAGTGEFTAVLTAGVSPGGNVFQFTATEILDADSIRLLNPDDRVFAMNSSRQEEMFEVEGVDKNNNLAWMKTTASYTYTAGDTLRWGATYLKGTLIDLYYALMTGCFALNASGTVSTTLDDTASAGGTTVPLTATTNVDVGDGYFLRNAAGTAEEVVVVDAVSAGVSITTRDPLKNTYSSGDAFESTAFPLTDFRGLPTGLGVPTYRMDATGLTSQRDDWLRELVLEVTVKDRKRGQSWLAENLFSIVGFPIVTPDGLVGFHSFSPRLPNAAVLSMDEASLSEVAWRRRWDIAYNRLLLRYDYDAARDKYRTETAVEDTASIANSGTRELVVELPGVVTRDDGIVISYVDMLARRFLNRYSTGAVELDARVHFTKRGAILGEPANVEHAGVPNVRTGARGLPARDGSTPAPGYDVIRIVQSLTPSPSLGMTLQDNGFTRPAFVGATVPVEYTAATAAQRLAAFIAPTGSNFTDGTEPYKVI